MCDSSSCALSSPSASSHATQVGADDKHMVSLFDLTDGSGAGGAAVFLADQPGQTGPPLQIHGCCFAPSMVAKAYCADSVWITTGEASHVKFWCWKPAEAEPLAIVKAKFMKVTLEGVFATGWRYKRRGVLAERGRE